MEATEQKDERMVEYRDKLQKACTNFFFFSPGYNEIYSPEEEENILHLTEAVGTTHR